MNPDRKRKKNVSISEVVAVIYVSALHIVFKVVIIPIRTKYGSSMLFVI